MSASNHPVSTSLMLRDILRAARLDRSVFERLAGDASRTWEAAVVVVAVAVLSTLGTVLAGYVPANWLAQPRTSLDFLHAVQRGLAEAIGFVFLSGAAYLTAFGLFGVESRFIAVLRALGFAYTPMVLGGLVFVPYVGGIVSLVGVLWTVATMTVALSAATDLSTGRAAAGVIWAFVLMRIAFYAADVVPG